MVESPARDTESCINELAELVRQDERRKAELVALLTEIKAGQSDERIVALLKEVLQEIREQGKRFDQRLLWVERYVEANYSHLVELLSQIGADIQKDRSNLNGVQKALVEHALEREKGQMRITAERDAIIGGDVKAGGNPDGDKD